MRVTASAEAEKRAFCNVSFEHEALEMIHTL